MFGFSVREIRMHVRDRMCFPKDEAAKNTLLQPIAIRISSLTCAEKGSPRHSLWSREVPPPTVLAMMSI